MTEQAIPADERTSVADGVDLRVLRWEPPSNAPAGASPGPCGGTATHPNTRYEAPGQTCRTS